jgi:hypothetical protein
MQAGDLFSGEPLPFPHDIFGFSLVGFRGTPRNSVAGRAGDSFDRTACLARSLSPPGPTTHSDTNRRFQGCPNHALLDFYVFMSGQRGAFSAMR